ncbi:hypothetical protein BRADI_2g40166v3 [Brachypodium distachyon]|uniref:Uncharacterized protein n=1 Tax=Brachypodium distachyon TaxID=15368 RepID=A0A0Q3R3V7_BRADI|nr:hypothetical protein BRADI_2g40166v3 [Brachypodium distachyon]KQK08186.1 hypothetical protein BRADI_2g40166v3 [Brachypodium distachyon]KQK08187.1 hypothetical protein BRADI_2g40166v3 [Brachypodium distachyon]PNT72146.1 hypothetical protein BRADI_2g40166v3 [Brachypodium distachyon]
MASGGLAGTGASRQAACCRRGHSLRRRTARPGLLELNRRWTRSRSSAAGARLERAVLDGAAVAEAQGRAHRVLRRRQVPPRCPLPQQLLPAMEPRWQRAPGEAKRGRRWRPATPPSRTDCSSLREEVRQRS